MVGRIFFNPNSFISSLHSSGGKVHSNTFSIIVVGQILFTTSDLSRWCFIFASMLVPNLSLRDSMFSFSKNFSPGLKKEFTSLLYCFPNFLNPSVEGLRVAFSKYAFCSAYCFFVKNSLSVCGALLNESSSFSIFGFGNFMYVSTKAFHESGDSCDSLLCPRCFSFTCSTKG